MKRKSWVPRWRLAVPLLAGILFACAGKSVAQTSTTNPPSKPSVSSLPQPSPTPSLEKEIFKNILSDQRAIILWPFHLQRSDARFLVPFAAATGALIATDRSTAGALDNDTNRLDISRDVSRVGEAYTTGGVAAAFYLVGRAAHNQRAREAGLLGAEALVDSGIDVEAVKLITQRERPTQNNGRGRFFKGGNSFPSGHSISAWSLATVVAEEYHRPLVSLSAYGLATAVSVSRYTGRNHFLSDILVGSGMGYGIGHLVYKKHHRSDPNSQHRTASYKEPSKLFPLIAPIYSARSHVYAVKLAWRL